MNKKILSFILIFSFLGGTVSWPCFSMNSGCCPSHACCVDPVKNLGSATAEKVSKVFSFKVVSHNMLVSSNFLNWEKRSPSCKRPKRPRDSFKAPSYITHLALLL